MRIKTKIKYTNKNGKMTKMNNKTSTVENTNWSQKDSLKKRPEKIGKDFSASASEPHCRSGQL